MTEKVVEGGVIQAKAVPPARPIDELVFKGHVHQARLNSGLFMGLASVLWLLFVLSLVRDIYGNTAGLQAAVHDAQTGDPSYLQRLKANPFQTLKSSFSFGNNEAPVIDERKLFEGVSKDQFDSSKLSSAQDVAALVTDELSALNSTQKMSPAYPCDRMKSLSESWLNSQSKQPDVPRCAYSADGDVIYQVSIVSVGSRAMPWIGVYRRDGDKKQYTYFNLRSRAIQTLQVQGYEAVEPNMIPRQMARDFPDLVVKVDGTKGAGK